MTFQNIFSDFLKIVSTTDDEVSSKVMSQYEKIIRKNDFATLANSNKLFKQNLKSTIELGLLCLPIEDSNHTRDVWDIIFKYADSDNWEIREYAGSTLGDFLKFNFKEYEHELVQLRKSDSENIRRCVVLGLKYLGKYKTLNLSKNILNILEFYFDDNSEYVKRNLGQFAIGDALILYDTDNTAALINKLKKSKNSTVRWNVAMIFSTASSSVLYEMGISILSDYIIDSDTFVRNAALKSLKNIYTRKPEYKKIIRKNILNNTKTLKFTQAQLKFLEDDI